MARLIPWRLLGCVAVASVGWSSLMAATDDPPVVQPRPAIKLQPIQQVQPAQRIEPAQQVQPGLPVNPGQVPPAQQNPFADMPATHEKVADISVVSSDGKYKLQTVGIDAKGRVLALTAPPKTFGAPVANATSEVHVYSPDGKPGPIMKVDFHANSIAGGPDGNIYVAGDGKIAKFSPDGKELSVTVLPFIEEILKDKDGPRKLAQEQMKAQKEQTDKIIKTYKERLEMMEAKKEEDRTAIEKRQIDQFKQILKSFQERNNEEAMIKQIVDSTIGRLRTVNAIAFSPRDVFVVVGDTKGFGYAVWRMDHNFKNAKEVVTGLRGCCGQMDVQTSGEDLLIAENTNHKFGRYDRDGKQLGAWGKRAARAVELDCFGGCCNPMNLRGTNSGDIITAESEGYVKRFNSKGEFVSLVASVPLTGAGCKNVAFAVSQDEERIFFLDLNGSRVIVLGKKSASK